VKCFECDKHIEEYEGDETWIKWGTGNLFLCAACTREGNRELFWSGRISGGGVRYRKPWVRHDPYTWAFFADRKTAAAKAAQLAVEREANEIRYAAAKTAEAVRYETDEKARIAQQRHRELQELLEAEKKRERALQEIYEAERKAERKAEYEAARRKIEAELETVRQRTDMIRHVIMKCGSWDRMFNLYDEYWKIGGRMAGKAN
jgi:hypothetical protein